MLRCAAFALGFGVLLSTAAAQVPRLFPPTALRGELAVVQSAEVWLNGRPARLAPGARIRNEENRFDTSGTLAGRRMVIHYTTDPGGQLLDIWILTPTERARQPWPVTESQAQAWIFDPVTQSWSRP